MIITVSVLGNLSFLSLLGSMIFYWIGVSFEGFTLQQKTDSSQGMSEVQKNLFSRLGRYSIITSNLLLALLLLLRWKESGHFPLSNLYESLMFLSWCFTGLHLFFFSEDKALLTDSEKNSNLLENFQTKISSPPRAAPSAKETLLRKVSPVPLAGGTFVASETSNRNLILKKSADKFLGAITTPSALFTNAFATFTLPKEMQEASPLVPALQSNWLMMHVTVMILSYAALILGSLLSIAYLIVTFQSENEKLSDGYSRNEYPNIMPSAPPAGGAFAAPKAPPAGGAVRDVNSKSGLSSPMGGVSVSEGTGDTLLRQVSFSDTVNTRLESPYVPKFTRSPKLAWILDNLSYRILGIGFPFLTIGILSGAVWANEAWGSYWSWDPKETWALLTWLIFAIYLHIRLNKGWEGKKPALVASFGFVIVWICYLGVNLIGEGLHSYGWIVQS